MDGDRPLIGKIEHVSGGTINIAPAGDIYHVEPGGALVVVQGRGNSPALVDYLTALHDFCEARLAERQVLPGILPALTGGAAPPQAAFDFSFRVATTSDEQPGDSAVTPGLHLLRGAAASPHGTLVVLGLPGAGKTMLQLSAARDLARRRLADPSAPVPLLVSLYKWPASQHPLAWAMQASRCPPLDEGTPRVFLLDGLDELGSERIAARPDERFDGITGRFDPRELLLRTWADAAPGATFITSRVADYDELRRSAGLPGFASWAVAPLTTAQVRAWLRLHHHGPLWDALAADPALLAMARTPLLLALLTVAFAPDASGQMPSLAGIDRDGIIDAYVRRRFEYEAARLPVGETLPFAEADTRAQLAALAYEHAASAGYRRSLQDMAQWVDVPEALLAFARRLHLLQKGAAGELEFIHLALRDFFATPRALADIRLRDMSARQRAASVIAATRAYAALDDLIAAARDRRLSDYGIEAHEVTYGKHMGGRMVDLLASIARALGELGDPKAAPALVNLLGVQGPIGQSGASDAASDALVRIGQPAVPPLLDALALGLNRQHWHSHYIAMHEQSDPWYRYGQLTWQRAAVSTLGRIGDPRALPLLYRLRDQGWDAGYANPYDRHLHLDAAIARLETHERLAQ